MNDFIEVTLPIETVSEANGSKKKAVDRFGKIVYKAENWRDKQKRHKKQKGYVSFALNTSRDQIKLPCHITLTRYAPRKLDIHDNLPMSLKWVLDAVCEIATGDYRAGRADGDERISVSYCQITQKEYAVKIQIKNLSCDTIQV